MASIPRILILGGYGNTGFLIAKFLLQETGAEIVIAGRNLDKAGEAAKTLNLAFSTNRVSAKKVDASNVNDLVTSLWDTDLVVVASSTLDYVREVASIALDTETDYFDVQLSSPGKLSILHSLRHKIESKQRCFITDGGFHPGVPAAMIRYAASQFEILKMANVYGSFQVNWQELQFSDSTISEFMHELKDFNPAFFKNGKWEKMGFRNLPRIDFGKLFGIRTCSPMFLEELRSLPEQIHGLEETGFYIAGFNWMTDYFVMPLAYSAFKLFGYKAQKQMAKLLYWSLVNYTKPPYQAVLQLDAKGITNHQTSTFCMKLSHSNAYVLTAIPAVACILQYLDGSVRKPGLWLQTNLVEPTQFFENIRRLGVDVSMQPQSIEVQPLTA